MSVIVDRLRDASALHPLDAPMYLFAEAADEIERLRVALARCAAPWDSGPSTVQQAAALLGEEFQRRMNIAGEAILADGAVLGSTKVRTPK